MMKKLIKAFTLIELLIVIVIIGILANAIIPRIRWLQDRAKYMRVEKDFQNFRAAVFMAQTNTQRNLFVITSDNCSVCKCTPWVQVKWLDPNNVCRTAWKSSLNAIELAAGMNPGDLNMETDPRGAPYLLNQNEWELIWGGTCTMDTLSSAGPDGLRYGIFVDDASKVTLDNRATSLAPSSCPWSY